ncbi:MAG: hypothetical protein NT010_10320 [Proteobacteria bacterium]|nr:hypothetical protein [Pseudomonadota bacterium]
MFFQPFLFFISMKIKYIVIFVFLSTLLFKPCLYAGTLFDSNVESALSSAESLFKMMKSGNYPKIWSLLTQKSKDVIIDDVYKEEKGAGVVHLKENINSDFNNGGNLSKEYWKSFLENFNPDTALEHSKWDTGKFEKDKGEIIIKYRKAENPAVLMMFKEDGKWKVGLVETFWTRKK